MKNIFILIFIHIFYLTGFSQKPVFYWPFNEKNFSRELFGLKELIPQNLKNRFTYNIDGINGRSVYSDNINNRLNTNALKTVVSKGDFSIQFAFKGQYFLYSVLPKQDIRIEFAYDRLNIGYTYTRNKKIIKDSWNIPLRGSDITSYSFLANDSWHQFVFVFKKSGRIEVYIDGKTDPLFSKSIEPVDAWTISGGDAFRMLGAIDEIAFYNNALNSATISKYHENLSQNQSYDFTEAVSRSVPKISSVVKLSYDTLEFAPGFPDYTTYATDQLSSYPDPRYLSTRPMPRNFPWLDITYLHREIKDRRKILGEINPEIAVKLTDEMARRWNYYIELPTLRTDAATAQKSYTNKNNIYYALIDYANQNPKIPVATVLLQTQNRPVHAGFDRNSSFITAQDLGDKNYLTNGAGKPIVFNKKKWISPFTSLDIVKKDGETSAFYINQLAKHLSRSIDIINENGEWFGNLWPEAMLKQSPEVKNFMEERKMNFYQFNGWMHHRFDSVYKFTLLNNILPSKPKITFYNVSAYKENYWPDFAERITTNSFFNGSARSTPSFYPSRPDNWRYSSGPLNGYGSIAEGRLKEIELGVKYFAPFVSAGWGLEEANIRPAQWLALLKSMVMLGADFFHVGYFNVTGGRDWANKRGPNDPRGYIYQVAMPSYAQAIGSRIYEFLEKGQLLNPRESENKNYYSYRFRGLKENQLILVRKSGDSYIIYGSVQPNSNFAGNVANEERTVIELEGEKIEFNIRKQGSVYYYNKSNSKEPVFYQLDAWHEYSHPAYWSKDFIIEAELPADKPLNWQAIKTELKGDVKNLTQFLSYVQLKQGDKVSYELPQEATGYVFLKIRTKGRAVISITLPSGQKESHTLNSKGFTTIRLNKVLSDSANNLLDLQVDTGTIDLDKIQVSEKSGL